MPNDAELVDQAGRLAAVVADLEGRIGRLKLRLQHEQQALFAAAAGRGVQILLLVEHLNTLAKSIEDVRADVGQALEPIDRILEAAEAVAPAGDEAVEPGESEVEAISDPLDDKIESAQETIEAFLRAQREALDAAVVQAGEEFREALSGELMEKIQEAVSQMEEAISEHAENLMAPLAAAVGDAVERLIATLTEDLARGGAETKRENVGLQTAVDALKPAVDGLLDQFKRVTALAETVGL